MRLANLSMAMGYFLVIAVLAPQVNSQEIAPVPPEPNFDHITAALQEEPAEPLPIREGAHVSCLTTSNACDLAAGCCEFQPSATCCNAVPYRCCCCGHYDCFMPGIHVRKNNGKLRWCRVWTTGDMYQHHAYYPAHHGMYYFRPYNYTNILEHKEIIVQLGGECHAPYSNAIFDGIYEHYYESNPVIEPPVFDRTAIPGASLLPNIEELLLNE